MALGLDSGRRLSESTASFINNCSCVATSMTTEESNTALVMVGNPIIEGHLKRVLHKRGWSIDVCGDGDGAVDRYVQLRPALVFIALDIPTLDGHVSALKM